MINPHPGLPELEYVKPASLTPKPVHSLLNMQGRQVPSQVALIVS